MVGSNSKRAQATEAMKKAVESAGGLVTIALVVSATALIVAVVAFAVATSHNHDD